MSKIKHKKSRVKLSEARANRKPFWKRTMIGAFALAIIGGSTLALYPGTPQRGMKFNEFMSADVLRPAISVGGVMTRIRKLNPSVRIAAERFLVEERAHASAPDPTSCYIPPVFATNKEGVEEAIDPTYEGVALNVNLEENVNTHEVFPLIIEVQNTGNAPWFSTDSQCPGGGYVRLATANEDDHVSPFFIEFGTLSSGWLSPQRIEMKESRVEPGETGTFVFWNKAPAEKGVYVEYFKMVREGKEWFEIPEVKVKINVGELNEDDIEKGRYLFPGNSSNTAAINLDDPMWLDVNLSINHTRVMSGDNIVRDFLVSPGAADTRTPTGTYRILSKQKLRIGQKWPHYHMEYWLGFTPQGHGFHALPYLANDGGEFWREAVNHLGSNVSHGCIRVGDDNAKEMHSFMNIGDKIVIHY